MIFHNVPAARRLELGEVAFLYGTSSIASRSPTSWSATSTSSPQQIRDRRRSTSCCPAARHAPPGVAADFAAAPPRRALPGRWSSSCYALAGARSTGRRPRRGAASSMVPERRRASSSSSGSSAPAPVLDDATAASSRTPSPTAATSLTQYPIACTRLAAAAASPILVPLAFVCYFPSLYILGQARSARAAAVRCEFCVTGRRACCCGVRRWGRLAHSPSGTTGAPADDRGRGAAKQFVVRARRGFRRERGAWSTRSNDISFRVERGELVGYLGPNGAGKSTTIKMLTGILVPTGGHVRVAGLEPSRQRIELARRIGAMFGQRIQLWWDLPLDRLVRAAAPHLPGARRPLPREPGALPRGARPRPVPADAGAPALARPAHPRRAGGRDAARARAALPRRADDRPRRRREAARARLPASRSTASAASPCC